MFMLISGLIGDLHHESHVCIIIVALRFSDHGCKRLEITKSGRLINFYIIHKIIYVISRIKDSRSYD